MFDAFKAYSAGELLCKSKTVLPLGAGHSFQSLSAAWPAMGCAVTKWAGVIPQALPGMPSITAVILLSDVATGQLRCMLSARHATALRTAAMSALAAQLLAPPDSRAIAFVGAGVQAHAHLLAIADSLVGLQDVLIASRTQASAQRMAEFSRERGFRPRVVEPREAVEGADVVVTSVPESAKLQAGLDASWLRPWSFCASVDLGRSWLGSSLPAADVHVVDHPALLESKRSSIGVSIPRDAQTLAQVVEKFPEKPRPGRAMYFSGGSAVADLAIAQLIHNEARKHGFGVRMPL